MGTPRPAVANAASPLPARRRPGPAESGAPGRNEFEKWVKPLLKLILDFGLAKGKSAVEFREGP